MLPIKKKEKNVRQPIRVLSSDSLKKKRKKKENHNGNELSREEETEG